MLTPHFIVDENVENIHLLILNDNRFLEACLGDTQASDIKTQT